MDGNPDNEFKSPTTNASLTCKEFIQCNGADSKCQCGDLTLSAYVSGTLTYVLNIHIP